jgi:glycosyltransferase involved in cell wall biosynthesis|tara:strand:+ start:1729 stop:3024 length:1296 start_codon:yes stop_codon:yes gene_type:complete
MSKPLAVVSCPIDTYSGYGARSRDFVKALIKSKPEWDVKVLGQRWGNTRFGYLKDHNEVELNSLIIPKLTIKPKIWFQISVPNEFQPVGEYNIGVTAGIETTVCAATWVQGVNRMDLVITSAQHGKRVFENSVYEMQDDKTKQPKGKLQLSKPVEVLFEGVDLSKYKTVTGSSSITKELDKIKEQFCFLFVGHWLQGEHYQDRKNVGGMIEEFLHTFKHTSVKPALILKTQTSNSSILDRDKIIQKIDAVKASIGVDDLPNIYLVHGELTDREVNELYNHRKVKSMISLTKGEGFGRPLLEFTTTGKPLITSGWSGQLDYLDKDLALLIGGTLETIHESAVVKDMLIPESKWFKYDSKEARTALKFVFKNYKKASRLSTKLGAKNKKEFSLDKMTEKLESILTEYVPFFPIELSFKPVLPKVIKINKPSKV